MVFVLTFGSTHKVLKAESILIRAGGRFRLDPAPGVLTVDCALVISVEEENLKSVIEILKDKNHCPECVYKKESSKNYVKV